MVEMLGLLLVVVGSTQGFLMTRVDPGFSRVREGQSVDLLCQVDSDYEFCKWTNPQQEICEFEWKRAAGNITMQEPCQFSDRIVFHAKYDDRECGIRILAATQEDAGKWECEIEDYVLLGSRGSGDVEKGTMEIVVTKPTTKAADTTTTARTSLITRAPRTTPRTKITTTKAATIATTTATTSTSTTTTSITTVTTSTATSTSESPVPQPSVQDLGQQTGGSSAGIVGGVLLALIIAAVAVFGVFYYRRRSRVPVVSYSEAAGMVAGSQPITIHSGRGGEDTNFHEYFPPNMTYSTSTPQSDA